jgi:signal transduction histidine kinase
MARRETLVAVSIFVVLGLLLSALAFLQVRLITRLGDWERERLLKGIQADADRFVTEFDGLITLVYRSFRLPPGIYDESALAGELARRRKAIGDSGLAGLVKDVSVATVEGTQTDFRRFDATRLALEPVAWPPELLELKGRIERILSDASDGATDIPFAFIDRLPGLVVEQSAFLRCPARPVDRAVWVIVTLDREMILGRWIPELVASAFSRGDPPEFDVAVVEQASPEDLLYSTDPAARAGAFGEPVLALDFFRYREPASTRWTRIAAATGLAGDRRAAPNAADTLPPIGGEDGRLAGALADIDTEGGWRLLVAWRSGSVEAAIARMQRNNIGAGLGMVALLGLTVAFVALSSRRARDLAAQRLAFVGGITHDFRTPLAVIRTGAENLAHGVVRGRKDVARYAGIILEQERNLADMVEQAMRFSGIRFPLRSLRFEPCEAREVVERALEACRQQLARHRISLRTSFAAESCPISADRPSLEAAFGHLVANAVKYRGASRTIEISVEKPASARGRAVEIAVRDHGIGIDPRDRTRLGEPFFRGSNARKPGIAGTGLGLAFVKEVVRTHRGRLVIQGQPGRGTTVTIRLPVMGKRAGRTA